MCRGLHRFLDGCSSSDHAVTEYHQALSTIPIDAQDSDPGIVELKEKAIKTNLAVISGERGLQVQRHFLKLVNDWNSAQWDGLRHLDSDRKFRLSLKAMAAATDSHRRLVNYFRQSRFQLLASVASPIFHDTKFQEVGHEFVQKGNQCDRCVDTMYTMVWARRASHVNPAVRKRAWTAMRHQLSVMLICSAIDERKHLLSQEAKPSKRGLCVKRDALLVLTYAKGVRLNHREKKDLCLKVVVPKQYRRRFMQCISAF